MKICRSIIVFQLLQNLSLDLQTEGDLETAASNDILEDEQEPEKQIEITAGNKRLSLQILERELAEVEEKVEERMRRESAIPGDSNYNADKGRFTCSTH